MVLRVLKNDNAYCSAVESVLNSVLKSIQRALKFSALCTPRS